MLMFFTFARLFLAFELFFNLCIVVTFCIITSYLHVVTSYFHQFLIFCL
jgi:hypothetical protein